jgi:PIN domain nuclease of toxin-antitoxin system
VTEHVAANEFRLLDVRFEHAERVEGLAAQHRDPFDRLLVAQALEEGLPIVSADAVFRRYGVQRIW